MQPQDGAVVLNLPLVGGPTMEDDVSYELAFWFGKRCIRDQPTNTPTSVFPVKRRLSFTTVRTRPVTQRVYAAVDCTFIATEQNSITIEIGRKDNPARGITIVLILQYY